MSSKEKSLAWKCYQKGTDRQFSNLEIALGPWTSYSLMHDPKHMAFVLSRYKFCAKMLEGKKNVAEIGFGDGFGIPIMAQAVGHLYCIDWDERLISGCQRRLGHLKNVSYKHADLNQTSLDLQADAAFCIDVIEHLDPAMEETFIHNMLKLLKQDSVLIIGTPNITASQYATQRSKDQHINLKSMADLKTLTAKYFKHVFMFGMNDEIVHTGYAPMSHYIWSVGVEKKEH